MALQAPTRIKIPVTLVVVGILVILGLVLAGIYLSRTPASGNQQASASSEATAYLPHLELSDVTIQASENFMKQQVVEIQGKIGNNGPRAIESIYVSCRFYGVDGKEVYRERVPIVQASGSALKPGETRKFRLPFDSLPDSWNQALPQMVIAQIAFAR